MARHIGPDDIERKHLQLFGPALGPVYHQLYLEVAWLHAKWLEFRKLFAHSQARIDLLNESATFFFSVVEQVLWKDVLLHIARLTDPAKMGNHEQLSLLTLGEIALPEPLATDVRKGLDLCLQRAVFAREWRNKRLAHNDLHHALGKPVSPLPGISRNDVELALSSFTEVLNRLYQEHTDGEVGYRYFFTRGGRRVLPMEHRFLEI